MDKLTGQIITKKEITGFIIRKESISGKVCVPSGFINNDGTSETDNETVEE